VNDPDARPYWAAAKRHELALQKCASCNVFLYPPGPACPQCGGMDIPYVMLGNRITGMLYSYIVPHRAFVPGFQKDAPYVVALAEVDQAGGAKLLANLVGCSPADVKIGMKLRMVWEDRTPEASLPQWAPL
jgi:uncharacterized OB-fold protein